MVTRVFVGSIVALVAGLVLGFVALWMAFAGGVFVTDGPDVVGFNAGYFSWAIVALFVLAGLAILGGAIGGLVSWIGALVNTAELQDKTWFVLLLVLGLFSFGFVAMLAYLIAGPDGRRDDVVAGSPPPADPDPTKSVTTATVAATTGAVNTVVLPGAH